MKGKNEAEYSPDRDRSVKTASRPSIKVIFTATVEESQGGGVKDEG